MYIRVLADHISRSRQVPGHIPRSTILYYIIHTADTNGAGRISRWKIDSGRPECVQRMYTEYTVDRRPTAAPRNPLQSKWDRNSGNGGWQGWGRGDLYPGVQLRVCICVRGVVGRARNYRIFDVTERSSLRPFCLACKRPSAGDGRAISM